VSGIRERIDRITGGAAALPLAIIFLLNVVDEFDQVAFGVLAPNIRDEFGLTDTQFVLIATLVAAFVILLIVPVSYFADRLNRVRMAFVAGLLWSFMAVLTGLAPTVVILVLARFGAGLGRTMNEPVHASLLADYYAPETHGRVFSVHRMGSPIGTMLVVGAGLVAQLFDWRLAFVVLAIPTWILLLFVFRLEEPIRGTTIDREMAEEADKAGEKVDFGEAYRRLSSVGTLKRLWTCAFFLGAAVIPISTIFAFFYEQVYGMDAEGPWGRAGVVAVFAAGSILGLQLAGGWAARAIRVHGDVSLLAKYGGRTLVAAGLCAGLMALAPWLPLSIFFTFLMGVTGGGFQAYNSPLVAITAPPRLRSQAFGYFGFFFAIGAILIASSVTGIGETEGYRVGVTALSIMVILSGFIYYSAHQFVKRDMEQAAKTLAVAAELRNKRQEGADDTLLTCRDVEVAYDQVQVLFGVDLEVRRGETVALLGTNGAGKSTLLNAISGTVDPIGGAIFFDGRDITHASGAQTAEMGIAQVPGGKAIFPTLTVAEHLRTAGWMFRDEPDYVEQATREAYDLFPRLYERRNQMAGNLSGGEQQMLGLSMAFMCRPKLLVIDELSLGLAPSIVEELLEVVRSLQARGISIIIVEQSINVALTIADRAYFLEKGEVRFEGPTAELVERDDIVRSVFLSGAAPSADTNGDAAPGDDGQPRDYDAWTRAQLYDLAQQRDLPGRSRMSKAELVAALAAADAATAAGSGKGHGVRARDLEDTSELAAIGSGDDDGHGRVPLLEVEGLRKRFGGITAVDGTDFVLRDEEILGLIGPNGAGKTTIFDLISGFERADEGRIVLCGIDVTDLSAYQRAWLGLGRSFQDARLAPSLTVAENIALSLERHLYLRDHLASLLNLPGVAQLERDIAWSVHDLIELMNLGAFRDKFARELSTGSRRIVDLAMCIAHEPRVLLLDEPSSGIAQREAEALGPLLRRITEETGCSLLVIEHDMPLITSISDRMIALELGRPLAEGTPAEVTSDPQVVHAYLGGDPAAVQRSGSLSSGNGGVGARAGVAESEQEALTTTGRPR
jgi:ABC-type branched-subunit amino acid transport system ATPase component/predicted MFS family arabinose efflux permease